MVLVRDYDPVTGQPTYREQIDRPKAAFTTAQRDALAGANLWRGRIIFNSDTGAVEAYYGATTGWKPPWNVAWGEVVKTTNSATTAGITAYTDVAAAAFTAVANRRYKITFIGNGTIVTATANVAAAITDNTPTIIQTQPQGTLAAGGFWPWFVMCEVNPSAGSITYRGRVAVLAGGGSITLTGTATQLHYLLVEDMGPNGNAPAS